MRLTAICLTAFLLSGCLSTQERAEISRVGEETKAQILNLEALINTTRTAIEDGTMTVGEGIAKLADLNAQKNTAISNFSKVQSILDDKPWYEQFEGWGQIALAIAGSIMGINLHRGPSSKKFKNGDGSIQA